MASFFQKLYKRLTTNLQSPTDKGNSTKAQLATNLEDNLELIKHSLGDSNDVVIRQFKIGPSQIRAFLFFIDGLVDKNFLSDNILRTLMLLNPLSEANLADKSKLIESIKFSIVTAGEVTEATDLESVLKFVLSGETALYVEGVPKVLIISTKGFESRGVQEPPTEPVVRGSREGFTENLRTNTSLIRRKVKNPNLRFQVMTVGQQTKTDICLVYIKGICNEKLVEEVRERISRIDTDAILESGYIEQFIEDAPLSPFPTVGNTEKPDVAAAKMMEGRITILVDGTPIALTVPYLVIEAFQASEDYFSRPYYASVVRTIRYAAFAITIYLPALYIALTTYHQEMIPTPLLITMASAREGTPFPAVVEAVLMGMVFEILREAGTRMPRTVGQAVSIVGALVLGDTAVSSGLVGAPMVMIIAMTAITSFLINALVDVTAILRLTMTLLAGAAGFYGIMLGTLGLLIHVVSLRSLGMPYLSPLAPLTLSGLKDVFIRAPLWSMNTRPRVLEYANWHRQAENLKPKPPKEKRK